MSQPFDFSKEIRRRTEPYAPLPECPAGHHLRLQFIVFAKKQQLPDSDLSPRTYQAFPLIGIGRELARQQHFNSPAQKILRGRIPALIGCAFEPLRLP